MKVWAYLIWLVILGWGTVASTAWSQGWLRPAPTYYRVTASLSHAGEQIEFDVVVRCDWKEVGGFGTPRRGRATRTPYVYGQRTKENHAVILQPPNGCLLTERVAQEFRPQVPDDLMPLVLWGDDADDLKLLVAYVSEAGYTHPLSKLTFHEASMTQANAEDYAAWMRIAKPNLITKMKDPFTESRPNNVRSGRSAVMGRAFCRFRTIRRKLCGVFGPSSEQPSGVRMTKLRSSRSKKRRRTPFSARRASSRA